MRDHGYARYRLDGCRCYACGWARAEYDERRNRLIAYGRWHPFVDAKSVREHVLLLVDAGVGRRRLAALSGISGSVLSKLLYGVPSRGQPPTRRLRPETARRLLEVEPTLDSVADGALVDATGSARRLRALIAVGWSGSKLADRLGMTVANFWTALGYEQVTARRARAVRALYDELWDLPPVEVDHRSRQSASRARNMAARNGWPPPMAWDDEHIDDRTARSQRGDKTPRAIAHVENTDELIRQGYTLEQAAERLGVSKSTITQARRRAGAAA